MYADKERRWFFYADIRPQKTFIREFWIFLIRLFTSDSRCVIMMASEGHPHKTNGGK
nr:MAG TPA: hypothetical protein [Caudoviricetes sp.]